MTHKSTCQSRANRAAVSRGNLKERFFAKNSPLTWRKVKTLAQRHSTRANAFLLWARNDSNLFEFLVRQNLTRHRIASHHEILPRKFGFKLVPVTSGLPSRPRHAQNIQSPRMKMNESQSSQLLALTVKFFCQVRSRHCACVRATKYVSGAA